MGRGIIKLTDGAESWYLEWGSICDAPTTYGMTLDELKAYTKDEYGETGLRELPRQLERIEATGTSYRDIALADVIDVNRAGPRERRFTLAELIAYFCRRDPAALAAYDKEKGDWP
jgi:hypothetical protein